ncbi:MAG: cellulase family glycosylhydrolase [Candidatus Moraniibacteriota bacterium]|nr:MAG: cellulase family glycosylhydrolase [Candidatus Moranbacteria bacterium]
MWWIIFSLLFLIALLFLAANFPGLDPREDVRFGVTFSSRFARDLGLDPHETLQAIFSDIGIQKVRIPVYWDLVEKQKGVFDFSDIDWQLEMARQNGADVILAMGQKVPRWPECFVPEWAKTSEDEKNNAALSFLRETVERYRDHSEIVLWQVENEPFLYFGTCLPIEASVLDAEIALVRLADPSRESSPLIVASFHSGFPQQAGATYLERRSIVESGMNGLGILRIRSGPLFFG